MIDPAFDSWQSYRLLESKRLLFGVGSSNATAIGDEKDAPEEKEVHLLPYVKLSNAVTLSALVQTPTLPASLNVSSSHSIAFFPSNVTVK